MVCRLDIWASKQWIYRCQCQREWKTVDCAWVFLKLSTSTFSFYSHLCIHSSCLQNLPPLLSILWNFSLQFEQYLSNNFLNVLCLVFILLTFLPNYKLFIIFLCSFGSDRKHPSGVPLRIHNHFLQMLFFPAKMWSVVPGFFFFSCLLVLMEVIFNNFRNQAANKNEWNHFV